jgi:hypothetical protein
VDRVILVLIDGDFGICFIMIPLRYEFGVSFFLKWNYWRERRVASWN